MYLVLFSLRERDRHTTTIHNVKRHCKLKGKQKINADESFYEQYPFPPPEAPLHLKNTTKHDK